MQIPMIRLPHFNGTVEVCPSFALRPQISHVVFDFDGTLSWIRHGWPAIMFDVFSRHLLKLPGESDAGVRDLLFGIIFGLNGKPTILQMIRFTELVRGRGGHPPEPETLRLEYQGRLDAEIAVRTKLIEEGAAASDDFIIFQARPLLQWLKSTGRTLAILSSTVIERVREEAALLQLAHFFGAHIYGGSGDPAQFSKLAILRRWLREEGICGDNLLSFGDGPVEIASTKELGGVAIAVCSDEDHNGSGIMDAFKRRQLIEAGADVVIPDYRDAIPLVNHLLEL